MSAPLSAEVKHKPKRRKASERRLARMKQRRLEALIRSDSLLALGGAAAHKRLGQDAHLPRFSA